jgi:hypothetical protein
LYGCRCWQPESTLILSADSGQGKFTIDIIFSERQLQKKCQEQNKLLFPAFIDLTKAFDLVSRSGLFGILMKIGYPRNCTPSSCPSTQTRTALQTTMPRHQTRFLKTAGQTEFFACTNSLKNYHLHALDSCFQWEERQRLPTHVIRWQAAQPSQTAGEVQGITIKKAFFLDDTILATHTVETL